jgi:hypothetical protein
MRRLFPLLTLAVFALAGCQAPVVILLAPEARDLLPGIQAALPAVESRTGLKFRLADSLEGAPTPSDVVYLSAESPMPDALVALTSVQPQWPSGFSGAPVLAPRGPALVLFWDLPGVTVFSQELPRQAPDGPQPWSEPGRGWPAVKRLVIAGAEPELRWAAWLGQSGSTGTLPTNQLFQGFSDWLGKTWWVPDAWRLTRADAAQSYAGGKGLAFVETFRDFYRANPPGFRRFFPLVGGPSERPELSGSALTVEAKGGAAARQALEAWLPVLTAPTFQREFSQKTGWMPANLAAPVLETASAEARKLLLRAASFTPTSAVTLAVRDQLQALFQNPARLTN